MATQFSCPICNTPAEGGYHIDDDTVVICPRCGGYRLCGTAVRLLELGSIAPPDPDVFRMIVVRKRGASDEYPVITHYDLGA